MRKLALGVVLGFVLSACSGSTHDKGGIWNDDSVGIDFTLTGPVGGTVCQFSAMRAELTAAQLEGLSSLRLKESAVRADCDIPTYSVTIHASNGSSAHYQATNVDCSSSPILLFDDFDAWAKSTPCSYQP